VENALSKIGGNPGVKVFKVDFQNDSRFVDEMF